MKPTPGETKAKYFERGYFNNFPREELEKNWDEYKQNSIRDSVYLEEVAKAGFEEQFEVDRCDFEANVNIAKSLDTEQICFGWANVALKADGSLPLDWQGDIKFTETLEKAAYNYVLKYRVANDLHEQNDAVRGELIESMMFTKEKMSTLGIPEGIVPEGWWVGFKITDPEVYQKVKSGVYKMFSIEGKARRIPIEIEED